MQGEGNLRLGAGNEMMPPSKDPICIVSVLEPSLLFTVLSIPVLPFIESFELIALKAWLLKLEITASLNQLGFYFSLIKVSVGDPGQVIQLWNNPGCRSAVSCAWLLGSKTTAPASTGLPSVPFP